jgi:hypothetical protein
MLKSKALAIVLFASILLQSVAVSAGIGASPSKLEYKNVLRGGSLQKTFTLFNTNDVETTYDISVPDEFRDWFTFYPSNSITVPANSNIEITAEVNVPESASNGVYETLVSIKPLEETSEGESNLGIIAGVGLKTTISVTGEQILSGNVKSVIVNDNEIGSPIRFIIRFSNTGNVDASPEIRISVFKGSDSVDTVNQVSNPIIPGSTEDVMVSWDTTNQNVGNYSALVEVYLNDLLTERTVDFQILEIGKITKTGEIVSVTMPQEVNLGNTLKIEADFKNTGKAIIQAKMSCEIYRGNELTGTTDSDPVLIGIVETKTITSYFKPESAGAYSADCEISYEGRSAEMEPMSFNVISGGITGQFLVSEFILPVASIIIVTIVVVLIIRRYRKRR